MNVIFFLLLKTQSGYLKQIFEFDCQINQSNAEFYHQRSYFSSPAYSKFFSKNLKIFFHIFFSLRCY
jgi:hypothetical protein